MCHYNDTLTTNNDTMINLPVDVIVSSHVEHHKGIYANIYSNRVNMIGQIEASSSSDIYIPCVAIYVLTSIYTINSE